MNELTVIERENQRVMTTAVLAEEYGTTNDVISKNFNRNKERYIEGKHYYCLEGEEKREFLNHGQFDDGLKNAAKIYLWTEKGAFLHAKSLGTDRAWEVYDHLVESYFKKKEDLLEGLSPELRAIFAHDRKLQAVESRVDNLENTMTIDYGQAKELEGLRKNRAIIILGGKNTAAYKKIAKKVFSAIGRDYKDYFDINAYNNTPVVRFEEAKEYLRNWFPDNNLKIEIDTINRGYAEEEM